MVLFALLDDLKLTNQVAKLSPDVGYVLLGYTYLL